jgi:hypothetical protein
MWFKHSSKFFLVEGEIIFVLRPTEVRKWEVFRADGLLLYVRARNYLRNCKSLLLLPSSGHPEKGTDGHQMNS